MGVKFDKQRGIRWAASGVLAVCQAGCSTWHQDTMSPHQLVAADCHALAREEAKLADNAKSASEGSYISAAGAMLMAVATGLAAGSGSEGTVSESTNQQANRAGENEKLAQDFEQRAQMVRELRVRKGCS